MKIEGKVKVETTASIAAVWAKGDSGGMERTYNRVYEYATSLRYIQREGNEIEKEDGLTVDPQKRRLLRWSCRRMSFVLLISSTHSPISPHWVATNGGCPFACYPWRAG